jgi:hypothetical protein
MNTTCSESHPPPPLQRSLPPRPPRFNHGACPPPLQEAGWEEEGRVGFGLKVIRRAQQASVATLSRRRRGGAGSGAGAGNAGAGAPHLQREGHAVLQLPEGLHLMCNKLPILQCVQYRTAARIRGPQTGTNRGGPKN